MLLVMPPFLRQVVKQYEVTGNKYLCWAFPRTEYWTNCANWINDICRYCFNPLMDVVQYKKVVQWFSWQTQCYPVVEALLRCVLHRWTTKLGNLKVSWKILQLFSSLYWREVNFEELDVLFDQLVEGNSCILLRTTWIFSLLLPIS